MKRFYDVVIMGGGPVGTSVALHLAKAGARNVLVVEKDPCYKIASAMLSAGGIRQQFSVPENIKMSMYGANFIKSPEELAVDGENPDFQFHENGYLSLANRHNRHVLESNRKSQLACGASWIKGLETLELTSKFDWLNTESIDFATFGEKNEGYFDPWLLVNAMKRKAQSLGIEFLEGAVSGGKLEQRGSDSLSTELTSVTVLNKQNITCCIEAASYINSAGAWSGQLLDAFASQHSRPKSIHPLPVKPRKRCIFSFNAQAHNTAKPIPPPKTPLVIDPSGVYFRPESNKFGYFITGVSPAADKDLDCKGTAEELQVVDHELFNEVIWPALFERVPAFEYIKVQGYWAGFYDYNTVDQNAIIGPHSEIRNLLLCTGFSGHGLQQAPAAGRAVSELILHKKYQSIDLTPFSFERIVNNKPIFETEIV